MTKESRDAHPGRSETPRHVEISSLVGPQEVAELLGVKPETVKQWRYRKVMPEPLAVISRIPIWDRGVIARWADETDR